MQRLFANKKLRALFWTFVLASLVLAACGGAAATETPVVATEEQTVTPLEYTPVSPEIAGATVYSQGVKYTVTGATTVTSEVLENDIVRYVINNEIVQGRVEAPLSIYAGEPWSIRYKQFDGINTNLDVVFNTTCSEPVPPSFTITQTVIVTCTNPDRDWTITAELVVHLKSTTDIQPPVPAYEVITWPNLEEGKIYLFCAQYGVKIQREAAGITEEDTCEAGKLINKLAYRVELYGLSYDDSETVIGTLSPDNVIGGYPWVTADKLLQGRVYYVCTLGKTIEYIDDSAQIKTFTGCIEAVYIQTLYGIHEFDRGYPFNVAYEDITGAFASPRP